MLELRVYGLGCGACGLRDLGSEADGGGIDRLGFICPAGLGSVSVGY